MCRAPKPKKEISLNSSSNSRQAAPLAKDGIYGTDETRAMHLPVEDQPSKMELDSSGGSSNQNRPSLSITGEEKVNT